MMALNALIKAPVEIAPWTLKDFVTPCQECANSIDFRKELEIDTPRAPVVVTSSFRECSGAVIKDRDLTKRLAEVDKGLKDALSYKTAIMDQIRKLTHHLSVSQAHRV